MTDVRVEGATLGSLCGSARHTLPSVRAGCQPAVCGQQCKESSAPCPHGASSLGREEEGSPGVRGCPGSKLTPWTVTILQAGVRLRASDPRRLSSVTELKPQAELA